MAFHWCRAWCWAWCRLVLVLILHCPPPTEALPLLHPAASSPQWVDLSHTLDSSSRHGPGVTDFKLMLSFNGTVSTGFTAAWHRFMSSEHTGTHVDAPIHMGTNGTLSVDQLPLDSLVAHAALVDITPRSRTDPDAGLTPADLEQWHRQHGPFVYPTIVLLRTGQVDYRDDYNRYLGFPEDLQLPETVDYAKDGGIIVSHFPGIGPAAAQSLAKDPAVVGVAVDGPSLDQGMNHAWMPAHHALFDHDKFGIENVADMSAVPEWGATILALPMKIGGGTGGPTRILVRLPSAEPGR